MERIKASAAALHVGERVRVAGWLHSRRHMGGITFLIIRDGWGLVQAVSERPEEIEPLVEAQAGVESVIALEGMVVQEPQAPGGVELHELSLEVITPVQESPVVSINKRTLTASTSTLLDHAALTLRHPQRRAVLRVATGIMEGFRSLLLERDFTEIQTPKIVAAATEGGANVFGFEYFGRPAYLAQSPQFFKQLQVGVFERVFEIGPVFRAELHDSTRHLNEYVSMDVELAFIENHHTIMVLLRDILERIMAILSRSYIAELEVLHREVPVVPKNIPFLHFKDAQELIFKRHGIDVRGEPDLSPQDERWLGEWAQHEFGSDFLFVTGYPTRKRPFYTHPDPVQQEYTNSFDLLFRGIELVTGGQRLHRYSDYVEALEKVGLPVEPFAYYLEAFKYGMPPHGGFGMGLERLVMQLLGLQNVKLATAFPRDIHRLVP